MTEKSSPQPAHTPAPWAIKFRRDHSAYISLGDPSSHHKQFDIDFDDRYPSDVADARLIAAAPDLLEALTAARAEIWRLLDAKGIEPKQAREWPEIVAAEKAIAKATGAQA